MLGLVRAMQYRRQQPSLPTRSVVVRGSIPRGHVFGNIMGVLNRMRERLHRVRDESLKKQRGEGEGPDFAQLGTEASTDRRNFEFESKANALRQMAFNMLGGTPWWRGVGRTLRRIASLASV